MFSSRRLACCLAILCVLVFSFLSPFPAARADGGVDGGETSVIVGSIERAELFPGGALYVRLTSDHGDLWVLLPDGCPPPNAFDSKAVRVTVAGYVPVFIGSARIIDAVMATSVEVLAQMGGVIREIGPNRLSLEVVEVDDVYYHPDIGRIQLFTHGEDTPRSDAYRLDSSVSILYDPHDMSDAPDAPRALLIIPGQG